MCILVENVNRAHELISSVLHNKKVTIKKVQKICGYLNFLCKCIIPGRAFTRCLYTYMTTRQNNGKVLLPHHHIKVNSDLREDLSMWNTFLNHPTIFCHPFMDFNKVREAREIDFFTDSSGNKNLRMGGVCGKS